MHQQQTSRKSEDPMRTTIRKIFSASLLLAGALSASASVTSQGWWHLDSAQPINDSSGNNRTFGSAFSTAPSTGGQFGGLVVNNGAGGPLGTTGYSSTSCVQVGVGVGGKRQSAMWAGGQQWRRGAARNYRLQQHELRAGRRWSWREAAKRDVGHWIQSSTTELWHRNLGHASR